MSSSAVEKKQSERVNTVGVAVEPRVMIIVAAFDQTGPVKGIFQLLQSAEDKYGSLLLYNFSVKGRNSGAFQKEAERKGIQTHFLEQKDRSYFTILAQANNEVRKRGINIVQTHGFKPTIIGLFLKVFCGIKWICFLHGVTVENLKVKFYHFLDNFFQQFADRVVLVSSAQRQRVFGGNNKRRVIVVHNAVDIADPVNRSPYPRMIHKELGLPEHVKLITVVGRFSPEKGVDVFIDAFTRVASASDNTFAILVGDGPERSSLEKQVKNAGIEGRVHFVGHSTTPGDYMLASDVIVLPSRSEGIPNVALEAMALGKPVIATAVGGTPEVIEINKSGILVPSEDPDKLASGILEVLQNERLSKRLSEGGLLRIKEHFSVQRRSEKILSIYRELLAGDL